MSDTDSLDFIRAIQITQFWRERLGEEHYHDFDPADLRRWYEAMDLRGPEDLRAYIIERDGRFPRREVVGLVTVAPHPPLELVESWLEAKEPSSYGRQALMGLTAFGIAIFFVVTNLHSCQYVRPPDQLAQFLPQAAVLMTAANNGVPRSLSTLPQSPAGTPGPYVQPTGVSVQSFQPNAPVLRAQQGTSSGTGGGIPGMNPFATAGGAPGMAASPQGTLPGGGFASPSASAFGSSTTASAPSMHSANSGSSSNLPGLNSSSH